MQHTPKISRPPEVSINLADLIALRGELRFERLLRRLEADAPAH